jgi:hypothetical protein
LRWAYLRAVSSNVPLPSSSCNAPASAAASDAVWSSFFAAKMRLASTEMAAMIMIATMKMPVSTTMAPRRLPLARPARCAFA